MIEGITLGDLALIGVDANGVLWDTDRLEGWGSPASTLKVEQRPRAAGGWAGRAFLGPRPIALAGEAVLPAGVPSSVAAAALSSAAAVDETLLTVDDGGPVRWAKVRRDGEVTIGYKIGSPSLLAWSVQLVAERPYLYGDELSGETGLPMSTGGYLYPYYYPYAYTGAPVSGQVAITNPGNAPGPVRLRIKGPCTGPVITHVGSGRALVFASSLAIAAGEFVDVDMDAHTVLAQGQASRSGWVTSRGWSTFEPGPNVWAFSAAVFDPAARLQVFATPAWE